MITKQQFSRNLANFSKLDDAVRKMFSDTAAYVIMQYNCHGNKNPASEIAASAGVPGWIKDGFKKIAFGKRDTTMTATAAEMRADALTALVFADQAQKRAIAKEQRAARAEVAAERKAVEAAQASRAAEDHAAASARKVEDIEIARTARELVLIANNACDAIEGECRELRDELVVGGESLVLTANEAAALRTALFEMRSNSTALVTLAA